MANQVLICDDSKMARKQMARALPDNWPVDVQFAENGQEAIDLIKSHTFDVLFLDLTMPVLDGYATLEIIRQQDLPIMVIVVSGDIQPEAQERVKKLGAIDFIKKPVNAQHIKQVLMEYGILRDLDHE